MATLVLQAAGALLGGVFGAAGAAIGSAAGSLGGYLIDRALIGSTQHHRGPRLQQMRPFTGEEGAPLPRLYGAMRTGGTLIWATRYEEGSTSKRQGFKGGPKVTTYSYFANAAFALCEGPIAGVRRIWADGREVDLTLVDIRIHPGTEDQLPDPLLEARQGEGDVPAYRGTAYAVIERFPLDEYGNRLPQFQFEVLRPVGALRDRVKSVALIPGSTAYGLATEPVTRSRRRGETETLNRHVLHAGADIEASLDELQMLCPNLVNVALVATWFGDDLRCGECRIRPALPAEVDATYSQEWRVSGFSRATAPAVSLDGGVAAYGGTPSDRSVIQAIQAIHARGWSVTLYPFVMMDIPAGNGKPDPYGGAEQAAHPWRGRITCHPGPGQAPSADATAAAEQVEHFAGEAQVSDFPASGDTVGFSGAADDHGYRRMVLHYAHLAQLAGGVDGFLIGSELRGLTTLRDDEDGFPFVEHLVSLAQDVRAILGPATKLSYGADWSEYFGHHPADGSGDVFFHLDPLWADAAIDAVGIDNYMPLSDWRDEDFAGGNPDGFERPYDRKVLRAAITAGEGFDWYYADAAARRSRTRSAISDGGAGKPWVFRYKDILSWWDNPHFDRVGGVEVSTPTAWTPRGKPIWFTELGCAAVDKGPNQPNVFPDPKSSENAIPHFSSGGRSDLAQRRLIEAHLDHWDPESAAFASEGNPVSDVYGGPMVDPQRIYLWAWDARPFPAFPLDRDAWGDGENWLTGHWLNGRLEGAGLGDLVERIADDGGVDLTAEDADGFVSGYAIDAPMPTRAALEPLVDLFGMDVAVTQATLVARSPAAAPPVGLIDIVVPDDGAAIELRRDAADDVPSEAMVSFADPMTGYQAGRELVAEFGGGGQRADLALPGAMNGSQARALAADWLARARAGRDTVRFAVAASEQRIEPGVAVTLPEKPGEEWLVTAVEDGLSRRVEARRLARFAPAADRPGLPGAVAVGALLAGKPLALLLDLPTIGDRPPHEQLRVAIAAMPWRTQQVHASPEATGFELRATVAAPSTIGQLAAPLGPGFEGRFDNAAFIDVELPGGELASVSRIQLLNGANVAAIRSDASAWEVVQFATAEEVSADVWRLGRLLRGQAGTGDAAAAGASAGADFALLDGTVVPAGLRADEIGLSLEWRIGPAGHDLSDQYFAAHSTAGGLRALLPLSPVHLRAQAVADGSIEVSWVRRGRIDADSWLGPDIPLGEATEAYSVAVMDAGETVRTATVASPHWTYAAADLSADFPAPAAFQIVVRQIGSAIGPGLPASVNIST